MCFSVTVVTIGELYEHFLARKPLPPNAIHSFHPSSASKLVRSIISANGKYI
jgi:hypothetical protein